MVKRKSETLNLLDIKPQRNLRWQSDEESLVVLLVPKFRSRFAQRWLVPHLPKPDIRVTLDTFGSYVWSRCDGKTTIMDIGKQMAEKFNEPLNPLYDRIGFFIQHLVRDKFLLLHPTNDSTEAPSG